MPRRYLDGLAGLDDAAALLAAPAFPAPRAAAAPRPVPGGHAAAGAPAWLLALGGEDADEASYASPPPVERRRRRKRGPSPEPEPVALRPLQVAGARRRRRRARTPRDVRRAKRLLGREASGFTVADLRIVSDLLPADQKKPAPSPLRKKAPAPTPTLDLRSKSQQFRGSRGSRSSGDTNSPGLPSPPPGHPSPVNRREKKEPTAEARRASVAVVALRAKGKISTEEFRELHDLLGVDVENDDSPGKRKERARLKKVRQRKAQIRFSKAVLKGARPNSSETLIRESRQALASRGSSRGGARGA